MYSRQACAIESAAYRNPNRPIFILFQSPVGFSKDSDSPVVEALKSYSNIHFRTVNSETFIAGTPAEKFWYSGELLLSKFLMVHTSDLFRFISLLRYGGVYLDLDVITRKDLDELPSNFAGIQDVWLLNNAVMAFQQDIVGHEIIQLMIKYDECFFEL